MAVRLQTMSYTIFSNFVIELGLLGGSKVEKKQLSVSWDSRYTTVTGARLNISAETTGWYTDMIVTMNAQQVYRRDWGAETGSVMESIDVANLLQNGGNIFAVTYEKMAGLSQHLTVTVLLEVDFEGTEPSTQPTVGGLPLSTVLIGGGIVLFTVIMSVVLGRRKK